MALLRQCWHIHYYDFRSQASVIASSFIKPPEKKAFDPEDLLVDAKIALFNDYFNMFRFCDLPRELRDLVYLYYFCPNGDRYIQVNYPWTDEDGCIYQGFVAKSRSRFEPKKFDTALLYANRQTLNEDEEILYGNSLFRFSYENYSQRKWITNKFSAHKNLQNLSPRRGKLVPKVRRSYFENTITKDSEYLKRLQMYTLDMAFLSQECSVTDLSLDGPFFTKALIPFAGQKESINLEQVLEQLDSIGKAWVRPLLGLKYLRRLKITCGEPRHVPQYTVRIDPRVISTSCGGQLLENAKMFRRFLDLPLKLREQVYRLTTLPSDNTNHPYIRSWYDSETRNIISLFLTCRQLHKEAEDTFYSSATFASSIEKYDNRFLEFLKTRGPTIRAQIRYVRILAHSNLSFELVAYLATEMPHVKLTYVLPEHLVKDRIKLWRCNNQKWADQWVPLFARFRDFRIETSASESEANQPEEKFCEIFSSTKWEAVLPLRIHYDVPQPVRF